VPGRRILVTGVANPYGARLAARLLDDPAVDRVVGVDTRAPDPAVAGRMRLLALDLRDPALGPAVRAEGVDAIVHNDVVQVAEPGRAARALHDVNVIGTLQLVTAAAGLRGLRTLVVRGSAAIYGSEPAAPSFVTEELARRQALRTRFQRDVGELEGLVDGFARRHPAVTCCVLRLQPVVGRDLDTAVMRLLRAPAVPTMLGFDPRVQLLDVDDAVGALHRAALHAVAGPVNVAPPAPAALSRVLRAAGRHAIPVAHPLFGPVVGTARRVAGLPRLPDEIERWLRFGRVVDTTRCRDELGFTPRHGTLEAARRAMAPGPRAAVAA